MAFAAAVPLLFLHADVDAAAPLARRLPLQLLPVAAYLLHPVTLHAALLGGVAPAARLAENTALLVAIAAAEGAFSAVEAGAGAASGAGAALLLALPATALSLATVVACCPLQGACLALALAPRLLFAMRCRRRPSPSPAPAFAPLRPSPSLSRAAIWLAAAVLCAWQLLPLPPGRWDAVMRTLQLDAASPVPEMSPTWYLFSEAFLRQLPYFVVALWAYPLLFPLPLALRFWARPRVAATAGLALAALFDPSGAYALERLPLVVALVLACPREAAEMRNGLLWLGLHAFALCVSPAMKALWLTEGSGNVNFMFNMHLIFALASGALVAEYCAAALRLARKDRLHARNATLAVG